MADTRSLLSVGIDVGTTTTQLVFARLDLANAARPGQIPRIEIAEKQLVYQSPIVFTPLADRDTIDTHRLTAWVRAQYAAAHVLPAQVETGAVIITGETAKKQNADAILRALGGLAGEFIVTVAGPYLESIIAGRGAGAASYTRQHFCRVTNIDIGGGSANSALFDAGQLRAAAAMNYGGRILEVDHTTGRVRHIAEPMRHILAAVGAELTVGARPDLPLLRRLTDCMADLTQELIEGTTSPLAQKLYLTPPAKVSGEASTLMFSGGIGHYVSHPLTIHTVGDATIHDDIGPLLAVSLREHPALRTYAQAPPAETVRATVLGASTQTVTLSGSTIWAEAAVLPLRNVPVIRPLLPWENFTASTIAAVMTETVQRWGHPLTDPMALALELARPLDYTLLLTLAGGLHTFAQTLPTALPFVLMIERDYAQALGQTLKALAPHRPLLVLDQVGLQEGDYVDIGAPLLDGRVVPLSIKTLVFYH